MLGGTIRRSDTHKGLNSKDDTPCMINLPLLAGPSRVASGMAQLIFEVR